MSKTKHIFTFQALLCLTFLVTAQVTEERVSFFHGSTFYTGLHAEYWLWSSTHTLETVVPLYYSMDLAKYVKGLALDVVSSPTYAGFFGPSEGDGIFGIANTKLRASYNIKNVVLATLGAQIPTSKNNLSASEQRTEGAISTRPYTYKVSRVRSGFDINVTVASSIDVTDELVVGGAFGYLRHGSYSTQTEDKYNPGDEFTITAGADYELTPSRERSIKLMGDIILNLYTKDKVTIGSADPKDAYDAANRVTVNLRAATKSTKGYYNRMAVTLNFVGTEKDLADTAIAKNNLGNEYAIADYHYFLNNKELRPHILGQVRVFTSDDFGSGSAVIGGVGTGILLKRGRSITIPLQAVVEAGGMNSQFILGIELSGGVQIAF